MYSGLNEPILLSYNSIGNFYTLLPEGPVEDSHKIYIIVNIIDDSNGKIEYKVTNPITVWPNYAMASNMGDMVNSNDPNSPIMQDLNSGNVNLVARNSLILSSVLNSGNGKLSNDECANVRDFLIDKISSLTVSDMSSIKAISTALSMATSSIEQVSKTAAVRFSIYL